MNRMNRDKLATTNRIDAWRNAAWYALIAATLMLVLIKFFTGIMFMTALLFAVAVFMIAFGFIMRLTPRER